MISIDNRLRTDRDPCPTRNETSKRDLRQLPGFTERLRNPWVCRPVNPARSLETSREDMLQRSSLFYAVNCGKPQLTVLIVFINFHDHCCRYLRYCSRTSEMKRETDGCKHRVRSTRKGPALKQRNGFSGSSAVEKSVLTSGCSTDAHLLQIHSRERQLSQPITLKLRNNILTESRLAGRKFADFN